MGHSKRNFTGLGFFHCHQVFGRGGGKGEEEEEKVSAHSYS